MSQPFPRTYAPRMWPRVGDLRTLELGSPGGMRAHLNALVLAGTKVATAGLLAEYEADGEEIERVGERLVLVDDDTNPVGTVEVTSVDLCRFGDVDWAFAQAEGEGFVSIEDWREQHARYWASVGTPVDDDTMLTLIRLRLV